MSSVTHSYIIPPDPVSFASSGPAKVSPHKWPKPDIYDTRKHGDSVPIKPAIYEKLRLKGSMGYTVLVDCQAFENEILPSETRHLLRDPEPAVVEKFSKALGSIFRDSTQLSENTLASTFSEQVKALNKYQLCPSHTATLSTYKPAKGDSARFKVDAALYRHEFAPTSRRPDWTHCRLFIEFKRGGTSYDPFDDTHLDAPESGSDERSDVRAQLIGYAHHTFLYQHRAWLYSLFINGREFRLMRWDRSGVIVTKTIDYVEDPTYLFRFLAYFGALNDAEQGTDPTATLLKKNWKAYKLMDDVAKERDSDLDHAEGTIVTKYTPQRAPSPGPTPPSSSPSGLSRSETRTSQPRSTHARVTRSKTREAIASSMPPPPLPEADSDPEDIDPTDIEDVASGDPRIFRYVRTKFRNSLEKDWPRYKILVGEEKRVFLVSKPAFFSTSMFGRATRGFFALDVKSRRIVFLKDSSRPVYVGVEPEGHYLNQLDTIDDPETRPEIRIPRLLCHGDVAGQCSFTAAYVQWRSRSQPVQGDPGVKATASAAHPIATGQGSSSSSHPRALLGKRSREEFEGDRSSDVEELLRHGASQNLTLEPDDQAYRVYTHYRLAVHDVCLPFSESTSSKQLVRLMLHCMITHMLAYEKLRLLHRDISAGNVLILPRLESVSPGSDELTVVWDGILTDWELAKVVPSGASMESPRQPERTGTWQFMSVAYIQGHPCHPVSIADELESFFHVLLFYAVRFLNSNVPDVGSYILQYFDTYDRRQDGSRRCNARKEMTMYSGTLLTDGDDISFHDRNGKENTQLNNLFASLLERFKARYDMLRRARKSQKDAKSSTPREHNTETVVGSQQHTQSFLEKRLRPPQAIPPSTPEVTVEDQDTERLSKSLNEHNDVVSILMNMTKPGTVPWPRMDAVPDRCPDHYDPRHTVLAMVSTTRASTGTWEIGERRLKRIKTEASEPLSLPTQPTAHRASEPASLASVGRRGRGGTRRNGKGKGRAR
ncbi:hypothetical protein C8Q77DRAFT_1072092 [Trametes polyzona]|nr:hypothetical protein C8Q77DRAFT_1072092 [Trametes polyzona]